MRRTDTLIVGGGPAGAAAAILLAQAGQRPLVLERSPEPGDALCGGFLSWRTLGTLGTLGIEAPRLSGHPIDRVRIFAGTRSVETQLPAPGIGLSRYTLDIALLDRARALGTVVERGVAVRAAEGLRLRLGDGGEIAADALVLATGKHELRGLARPRDAAGRDPAVGLRVRLDGGPRLLKLIGHAIELHCFSGGYAGLLVQENGSANLCMAVRRSRLAEAGGDPATLLTQIARECLPLAARIDAAAGIGSFDAVAQVPYGWRARAGMPGLFRVGDQAGVIPSLAGEGIGIALASGIAAAAAISAGGAAAAPAYQRALARRLRPPLAIAGMLRSVAERPTLTSPALVALGLVPAVLDRLARLTRIDSQGLTRAL